MRLIPCPPAFKILAFLFIILIAQSCGNGHVDIWANSIINDDKQAEFHDLNTKLFDGLKDNRFKLVQYSLAQDLLDEPKIMRTVEQISTRMKEAPFVLQNEYYVVSDPGTKIAIGDRKAGINNFDIHLKSTAREMYLAFFVQQHKADKWMIAAIYAKFDYGWKIDGLYLNPYTLGGKTAPELYKQAKEQYRKGYLIDARNTASLARYCANPGQLWQYQCDVPLDSFYYHVKNQVDRQYHFPYQLTGVATHPSIIGVYNRNTPEGEFPVIYYLSTVNLKDTIAIKKENAEIGKVIGKVMPGIDIGKKYVLYAAYNKMPTPAAEVEHFDMTTRLR